jgi:hypothetical protein
MKKKQREGRRTCEMNFNRKDNEPLNETYIK